MRPLRFPLAIAGMALALGAPAAFAETGVDACLERLREQGPDARNGIDVLATETSPAGTRVTMRDAGGSVWECLGHDGGGVDYLTATDAADDGAGAMGPNTAREGPESDGGTTTEIVRFARGASGARLEAALTPGGSVRYVLGARAGQELSVHVTPGGPLIDFQIFNPDQSFLRDLTPSATDYRGRLVQSGDHVVEVLNRGDATSGFTIDLGIK